MAFLDAFNYWSVLHLLGSFVFTVTLGSLNLPLGPISSGSIVLGMGAGWEMVADQALRLNDKRGGDYYDVAWDLAGCALGAALLEASDKYHLRHTPRDFSVRCAPNPNGLYSENPDRLGLNTIVLRRKLLIQAGWLHQSKEMASVH